jgi:hypothetical protein
MILTVFQPSGRRDGEAILAIAFAGIHQVLSELIGCTRSHEGAGEVVINCHSETDPGIILVAYPTANVVAINIIVIALVRRR